MIISRTPLRISFAGGGSDISDYYQNFGGSVLSVSINKYVYLSLHDFFYKKMFFLKYSQNELVENITDIKHKIIKEVFTEFGINGVDFNSSADIPSGTGLGSSSAFTVGLINLCNAYSSKFATKEQIAQLACSIEIERLKEPIGKQDQYACTYGGLNYIKFNQDESVMVEKIFLPRSKMVYLNNNLLLFFTGKIRSASMILSEQKANIISDKSKVNNLKKIVQLSNQLKVELQEGNIDNFGNILHEGWVYKKELAAQISDSTTDFYYEKALKNGAKGGKLLGAGGGGFLLFFCPIENQTQLISALSDLYLVKFNFDEVGTTIIYSD